MEFEWDEAKRRPNVEDHGFDFLDGVMVFAGEYYCRLTAAGWRSMVGDSVGGIEIAVAFALRGGREAITRISAQEALRRIERGESLTDWARVRAMSDMEVELATAGDSDWLGVDPDGVAKAARIQPVRKRRLTLALDEEVID